MDVLSATTRRRAAVAVLCALIAVTAACTKADHGTGALSPKQNRKNVAAARALPATDVIAAPRSRLKDGGSVDIPIEDYPQNFNQFTVDGNDVATELAMSPTVPEFFDFTADGRPVADPEYLQSAKVTGQNPFTVEFRIDPEAVWSDGTHIGYQDFRGEWKAMNGRTKAYEPATTNGFELITGVRRGANDQDVIVTFSQRYAAWPALFDRLLPRSVTASPSAFQKSWKDKPLLSAGPFEVSSVDPTAQVITLTRNPKWWGRPPKLDQIVMRALSLSATAGAFKNGEIDIVDASKDPSTLKAAEQVNGTRILRSSSTGWHLISLNARSPLLRDQRMRRAIALGIPRDQIARLRQAPFGAPPTVLNNHILGVTQAGYQDDATAVIGPDPKKAAALLDKLGWKRNGKYRTKDGKTLTLREYIPSDTPSQTDVSQVIQKALGDIGVKIDIISLPIGDFADHVNQGDFDVIYMGWSGSAYPACDMKSIFYPATSPQNKTGASSPRIGALFDQACATLDEHARIALANQIDKQLFTINTMLPLFNDPEIAASKPDLANVKAFSSAFQQTHWEDVGWIK